MLFFGEIEIVCLNTVTNHLAYDLRTRIVIATPMTDETLNLELGELRCALHSIWFSFKSGMYSEYAYCKSNHRPPNWGL